MGKHQTRGPCYVGKILSKVMCNLNELCIQGCYSKQRILLRYYRLLAPCLKEAFQTCLLVRTLWECTTMQSLVSREKVKSKNEEGTNQRHRYSPTWLPHLGWGFTSWLRFHSRATKVDDVGWCPRGKEGYDNKEEANAKLTRKKHNARSLSQCFLILHLVLILNYLLFQQIYPNYNGPGIPLDTLETNI